MATVAAACICSKTTTLVGTDLVFRGNVASGSNGRLYLGSLFSGPSTSTLKGVISTRNTAIDDGGSDIAFYMGALTIRRGLIANNTTPNDPGGGLYLIGSNLNATLENVTVSGNTANSGFGGGGIYHSAAGLTLRHGTIAENTNQYGAGQGGGPLCGIGGHAADDGQQHPSQQRQRRFPRSSSSTRP